ncbi:nucleic acid-binding, OB-fold protein [Tanacetum coccineum]
MAARNPILTDYIGRIRAIGRLITKGDAISSRTNRRVIDIENLSGNTIGCTLWNEMAINFDVRGYDMMEKPVIIAVSSCYINRYNGMQLSGTSATHYYLNPNIPETYQIRQMFPQLPDPGPTLDIVNHRYADMEAEKTRYRFPLAVLREIDPQSYQRVRFTTEATIYTISTQRRWCYQKCSACGQMLIQEQPFPKCKDHGPQTAKVYSYCFKAIVNDGSATTSITCFSDQANTLTRDVNQVVEELADKNPYKLPPSLKQLEGTTHIFQFHFDTMVTARRPDFILDQVFQDPVLALPPPIPTATPQQDTQPNTPTNLGEETLLPQSPERQTETLASLKTTSTETNTQTPMDKKPVNEEEHPQPQPHTLIIPKTTPTKTQTQTPINKNPATKEEPRNQLPKPSVRKTLTYTPTAPQPTISETSTPTAGLSLQKKASQDRHESVVTQAPKKHKGDP